jgi:4-amino-4-deoxy-L-arabinose transferase-like glycosyltransferase
VFALPHRRTELGPRSGSSGTVPAGESGWFGPSLLVLIVVIASFLRLWHLGHQSLWIDELGSLLTALPSLAEIPAQALRHDAFEPPLYFWLLHGMIHVAGPSEWALRLLSAVAGSLTVPVVWLLLREVTQRAPIAHTGALLLATNPLHLWYSQEARPYALLVLFGSGALLCLSRALRRGGAGWWIGFSVLSAAAILTHVTGVVYPGIGGLWALQARGARVFARLSFAAAGVLALTLPFFTTLATAVRHAEGTGSPQRPFTGWELPYSVFTFVAGYSFGPPVREIQDVGSRVALAHHPGQTSLVCAILLSLVFLLFRARRLPIIEVGLLFLVPLAAATAGSLLTTKTYNVRYVLPGLVGFLGLAAVAMCQLKRRDHVLALSLSLGVFVWSDVQWFGSSAYWKEDSRAAAACLTMGLRPGSTAAVAPPYMRALVAHYAPETSGLRVVGVADSSDVAASGASALAITRPSHIPVPAAELVRAFNAQFERETPIRQVVGYRLVFAPGSSPGLTDSRCGSRVLGK